MGRNAKRWRELPPCARARGLVKGSAMRLLPLAMAFSLTAVCYGDIITLKNGRTINGTYLGGTPRQIKVEVGDNIQTVDVGDIARIEFNGGGSTSSRDS